MNAWLNDAANIPTNDHAAFNNTIDPSATFLQGTPSTIDPSQFQNPQLFNGTPRNASPAFHNPVYQVNPVVPSKRPRPREDSIGTSPRQAPGSLPGQRSQTPHQPPYATYNGSTNGTPAFAQPPTPYQHLQQGGSSNATPSPIMQNQHFNPGGMAQRVGTASPSPFPNANAHMASQMSPPPQSDPGSRMGTPQNYMQGLPYGQGFNQNFASPGMNAAGMQGAMQPQQNASSQSYQQQMNAQRAYQMRIQAQLAAQQNRPGMNPMGNPMVQMQNPQMAGQERSSVRASNPEEFIKQIQGFMQSKGLPFDPNPIVGGRPINLMHLWASVLKAGGSTRVSQSEAWSRIAQLLQFPPMQYPNAAHEIQTHYLRNLAPYEQLLIQKQRERALNAQRAQQHRQPNEMGAMPNQISPTKLSHPQARDHSPNQPQHAIEAQKSMPPMQNNGHPAMNGFGTPPQGNRQPKQQQMYNNQQRPIPRPQEAPPQAASQFPVQSPLPPAKRSSIMAEKPPQPAEQTMPMKQPIEDPFKPTVLPESRYHGPIIIDEMFPLGAELINFKPTAPHLVELGVIDIHAVTMSIKSGLHAEVRMALDTLATLSVESTVHLELSRCPDLVEALIDCAEDQIEVLAEHAPEVSDVMLISSYEDVVRSCRAEIDAIQDVPMIGSVEYELDRSVDRLICISTILRNFSFYDPNHLILVNPEVIKMMSTVIRYLGTRYMLLRTNRNTLDFMKDIITYLSNVSQAIVLEGKEEALCLLHFLLSFAPCPTPSSSGKDVMFTFYNPTFHKYTPPAIDSLAKLLARDEPNRTYYKAIFAADCSSNPPYDLLTRAFALAISPIPDPTRPNFSRTLIPLVDCRKPFLLQGMLAAEALANLAPGPDTGVARSWLNSTDGFASCLLRVVNVLATDRSNYAPPQRGRQPDPDQGYSLIVFRGLNVLHRLVEKSKNPDKPDEPLPSGIFPSKVTLMGAMGFKDIEPQFLRRLCAYAALED